MVAITYRKCFNVKVWCGIANTGLELKRRKERTLSGKMRHRLTLSIFVYNTEELIHAFYAKECKIHKFYTILCHVSTSSLYCPRTGEFCSPRISLFPEVVLRVVENNFEFIVLLK